MPQEKQEETERIAIRLPAKLVRLLRKTAAEEERPMNTVVARALRLYFQTQTEMTHETERKTT